MQGGSSVHGVGIATSDEAERLLEAVCSIYGKVNVPDVYFNRNRCEIIKVAKNRADSIPELCTIDTSFF